MIGVTPAELAAKFPRLYHMAEIGSWPSIQRHGLLSTSSLLDLFNVPGGEREVLEARHRPECVTITHEEHGQAVIRDNKPMTDADLRKCLRDDLKPSDWYRLLNSRVFFWLTEKRLSTLLFARAYKAKSHVVITLDTALLLEDHISCAVLSPINSGATRPNPQPRGLDTFLPLDKYPFDDWKRKRRGRDPAVELALEPSLPGIEKYVLKVENRGGGADTETIWEP